MLCPIVTKESIFMEMTFLKLNVEFYFTVFLIIRNELYVRKQKKINLKLQKKSNVKT
jgi:hypothetical protein